VGASLQGKHREASISLTARAVNDLAADRSRRPEDEPLLSVGVA